MACSYDACVDSALAIRRDLTDGEAVTACRVFNGIADGIEGLVVEKIGDVLIAQLHEGRLKLGEDTVRFVVERMHDRLGTRAVYRKTFVQDRAHVSAKLADAHRDAKPWIGEAVEPDLTVAEYGLRFVVRPYDGLAVGLFFEHRENRRRIGELSGGRRVLNAFAYTCGFSVAAAAGGAASVDSVDLSKRYLEWGKRNFGANQLAAEGYRFFCCDVLDFYKRATRQGRRYDLIVLDPPTFSRQRRPARVFVLADELERLAAGAVQLLDPGGQVFLSTNDRRIGVDRLEAVLVQVASQAGRCCRIVNCPPLPVDFAGDPDYSKSVIVQFD